MPERAAVNEVLNLGLEATPGTQVAAGKQAQLLEMIPDIELDMQAFGGQGRQQAGAVLSNMDYVTGKWSTKGNEGDALSYFESPYILSALMGRPTPATHAGGTNAKDWIFDAPLSGDPANPIATYTAEQGQTARAHKYGYVLFKGITIKGNRAGVTASGTYFAQKISDGITLTSSPTRLRLSPILGADWTVYRDTTSAGLGTTQLLRVFEWQYTYDDVYVILWPGNKVASNNTFAVHVRKFPKHTLTLKVEADAQGMSPLADARTGTTEFIRIDCVGSLFTAADGTLGAGDSTIAREFKIDLAAQVGDKIPLADGDELLEDTITYKIVEDTTWNHAALITVTNMLAAL